MEALNNPIQSRIVDGIYKLPNGDIKKLKGYTAAFRLRIGDYRILFEMSADEIYISDILLRGEAYKKWGAFMAVSRQQLHVLVDMMEESDFTTLYNVMIRFIPEDEAAPDEIEAIEQARAEYKRGETVRLADLKLG